MSTIFWDVTSYNLVKTSKKSGSWLLFTYLIHSTILKWKHVPPKRGHISTCLQVATSQMRVLVMTTSVRSSELRTELQVLCLAIQYVWSGDLCRAQ